MDVDSIEASIDWATVCVYTCAASCSTIKKGFSREFVVKYDFLAEQQQREVNG
jgi:pre-rRNA-processing protein TSR4